MSSAGPPRRVVVVGGGISGLAAAHALRQAAGPAVHVTVLEKATVVGGHLRLVEVAGIGVDGGAESLLNRRPEAVDLVRAVGLGDDLVHPADVGAGLWSRGHLVPIPAATVMGVPTEPSTLGAVLSPAEIDRVGQDRSRPGMPLHEDVAIGRLVADRMGRAVVDRLVDPLLGGVYAGRADELSLRATVPALAEASSRHGSLLAAARSVREAEGAARAEPGNAGTEGDRRGRTAAPAPVFAGIRGGVGRLPAAVASGSGAEIRTGVTVRRLTRHDPGAGGTWRLEVGPAPFTETVEADAVVLAVPAAPAARLFRDVVPAAAADLGRVEYASVAIVTLVLRRSAFPRLTESSGFLIPPVEGRAVKAVTLSSVKWPWLAADARDLVVLRASLGRHRDEAELQHDDAELVQSVMVELGEAVGVTGRPVDSRVTRWGGALPQYAVGHADRMARVLAAVEAVPGLAVCGAAYDGVGVAACIATAQRAATTVLDGLGLVPVSTS
jgi:protoporphyrinogen/coproporphyrinogen III oxidase